MLVMLINLIKWILILLASLAGLILLLFLLIILIPIKYKADFIKDNDLFLKSNITWLYPFISIEIIKNEDIFIKLKFLGISIFNNKKTEKTPKKESSRKDYMTKKERVKEEMDEGKNASSIKKTKDKLERNLEKEEKIASQTKVNMASETLKQAGKNKEDKHENLKGLGDKKNQKSSKSYNSKSTKAEKKFDIEKIKSVYSFLKEEESEGLVKHLFKYTYRILKTILPQKCNGKIVFGFDDPALTGFVTGLIYSLYPIHYDKLEVKSDFNNVCLYANIYIKGRIWFIKILYYTARLLIDKKTIRLASFIKNINK